MKKRKKFLWNRRKIKKRVVILPERRLEIKEELQAKLKAFWTNENDYLDVLYQKINDLQREHEKYRIFYEEEILSEFESDICEKYLRIGKIKNWIKVLEDYHIHKKGKSKPENWGLGYFFVESEEWLELFIIGLGKSLTQGVVTQEEQEKLLPLLQDFPCYTINFPNLYLYLLICHGIINSKKSIPFVRKILNEADYIEEIPHRDDFGELHHDSSKYTRRIAVKALMKISEENEVSYLVERFNRDPSPAVKQVIYHELKKIDSTETKTAIKDIDEHHDYSYVSTLDSKFVLTDFDEAYKIYF
ncbi:MAG: HEAT repeat domain-containing protein [Candidatus Heimdallarchaeota archaeon]